MASSSGTSSSSLIQNSGSEEDLRALMDQRKRKRMISNRESARRSRLKKQKHLDDLMAQVAQLRRENQQIITSVNLTTQHYLTVEAENSVLRAQVNELTHRLQSLDDIIDFLNASNSGVFGSASNWDSSSSGLSEPFGDHINNSFMNPLNNMIYLNQPIMASADIFQC